MVRTSFQARIASVLILLLLVVIGALYFAVQAATNASIRTQAREQLDVGTAMFGQLLDMHARQLKDAVQVLTTDFGFREAVASDDEATIRSALLNQGARINAGVVMMFNMDGKLTANTLAPLSAARAEQINAQLSGQGQSFLMPFDGSIYLLVQATVSAPLPIARLVMGFAIDDSFARELNQLTHLDLTLTGSMEGQPDVRVSTLDDMPMIRFEGDSGEVLHGGEPFLVQRLVLASGDGFRVQALLQRSLEEARNSIAALNQKILLIAMAALVASLVGALLLARSLSRPIRRLADAADRVGKGDYDVPLALDRADELGSLAKAFQGMQHGIAERERQLAYNALHDSLTGLPNRNLALERLGSAISADRHIALLYLGIGNFRTVSESCEAGGGDRVVQQLVNRLQVALRPRDSMARLVGDEFVLLLEGSDVDSAVATADRIQQLSMKPFKVDNVDLALDCRIGIAAYPTDGSTPEELLRRAAIAMQDAGHHAGRIQVYESGRDIALQRQVQLIRDLRRAAQQDELLLHYQPKLDLRDRTKIQAEGLLRWQHPQLGMISPGEFIPLAERTGSIQLLSAWVIEEGVRQLQHWRTLGFSVQLSLNISTEDLLDTELPARVGELLAHHDVPGSQLTFEITESGVMLNPTVALQVLHGLREKDICLSVDDFGTGYSSLTQLKRMPVQELKIDQAFIRDLHETSEDAMIVRSTIEMSHSLGLTVVAEGVELQRSLDLLERWNCDSVQGYLISRPLPVQAFEAWMQRPSSSPNSLVH
ncbi:EAL domain-containing protein [Pseudomonas seleniipraecipitans]|uniref:Diguanylate cyclase/phosphodiesterase n=1 Tax=Phytopseudomonas seleniipraecipitans TaxID=640205 RepID=A0A1G7NNL5_9GAMM|nr:EAL domain-containing protein [Pseudomonas seleniipraecipitans]UUD65065.1 EAL domain-containing protein [Pseudomonas seleniipraecipitans]SDF75583.1 diguanylate cyclase/phosphodiesterase [Pseudomonas seleniipraecipitans]